MQYKNKTMQRFQRGDVHESDGEWCMQFVIPTTTVMCDGVAI